MPNQHPRLTASQEDYLETIYHLVQQGQVARASEISRAMEVHKSSVTGALKGLARLALIHYEPYGHVTLTEAGNRKAQDIVRRHETLMGFFRTVLGIDGEEAEAAACRMEHAANREVVNRLILLGEFLERSGKAGKAWRKDFQAYCREVESRQAAHREKRSASTAVPSKRKSRKKGAPATLRDLEAGDRAVVSTLTGTGPGQQRLIEAGATEGAIIEVEKSDARSVQVQIRGYHLSLQSGEAEEIGIIRT